MAISKKTRFEVFKRDSFTCAYCGNTPPAIILEVDHILPRAKKGLDDINNLITACFDCNRGKSDRLLTRITSQMNENFLLIREKEEQLRAYYKFVKKIEKHVQQQIDEVDRAFWNFYEPKSTFIDTVKQGTLKTFLKNLTVYELIHAVNIAQQKFPIDYSRAYKYFCGICWNWIKNPETKAKKYGKAPIS